MSFWLMGGKAVSGDCLFPCNDAVLKKNSGSHLPKTSRVPGTLLGAWCISSHFTLLTTLFYRYHYQYTLVWKEKLRKVKTRFIVNGLEEGAANWKSRAVRLLHEPQFSTWAGLLWTHHRKGFSVASVLNVSSKARLFQGQAEARSIPFFSLLEFSTCIELLFSVHFMHEGELTVHMVISQSWAWQGHLCHSSAFRQ